MFFLCDIWYSLYYHNSCVSELFLKLIWGQICDGRHNVFLLRVLGKNYEFWPGSPSTANCGYNIDSHNQCRMLLTVSIYINFLSVIETVHQWGAALMSTLPKVMEYIKSVGRDVERNESKWWVVAQNFLFNFFFIETLVACHGGVVKNIELNLWAQFHQGLPANKLPICDWYPAYYLTIPNNY